MDRSPAALRPLALVRDAIGLLLSRFSLIFPLAFVPSLALAAFAFLAGTGEPVPLDPVTGTTATRIGFGALFIGIFLEILVGFVAGGVLMLAAIDALLGNRHGIGAPISGSRCGSPGRSWSSERCSTSSPASGSRSSCCRDSTSSRVFCPGSPRSRSRMPAGPA